jgi:hypothetical protein
METRGVQVSTSMSGCETCNNREHPWFSMFFHPNFYGLKYAEDLQDKNGPVFLL